jgi:hypothetical protein
VPSFVQTNDTLLQCYLALAGAMTEDQATASVLSQQRQELGSPAYAMDSKLTAMGKEECAIPASPFVVAGGLKITEQVYNKVKGHRSAARTTS